MWENEHSTSGNNILFMKTVFSFIKNYMLCYENIIFRLWKQHQFLNIFFSMEKLHWFSMEIIYVWRNQNSTFFILNTYCLWKLHVLHPRYISNQQQFWNCSYFQWQKSKREKLKPLLNPEKNKLFTKTYCISWQIVVLWKF